MTIRASLAFRSIHCVPELNVIKLGLLTKFPHVVGKRLGSSCQRMTLLHYLRISFLHFSIRLELLLLKYFLIFIGSRKINLGTILSFKDISLFFRNFSRKREIIRVHWRRHRLILILEINLWIIRSWRKNYLLNIMRRWAIILAVAVEPLFHLYTLLCFISWANCFQLLIRNYWGVSQGYLSLLNR